VSKPRTFPSVVRRFTAHVRAGRRYDELQVGRAEEYEDGLVVLTFVTIPVHFSTWDGQVWLTPCDTKGNPLSSPSPAVQRSTRDEEGGMRDREAETDGLAGTGARRPMGQERQEGGQTSDPSPPPPPDDPTIADPGHGVGSGGGRGGTGEEGGGEESGSGSGG
jgi:hypothetical protein